MNIYSCESHINQALDDIIVELEMYPIMEKIESSEKLSTKCTYCENGAIYVVANK